jgi:polyisoprenoid-binding protein YceI
MTTDSSSTVTLPPAIADLTGDYVLDVAHTRIGFVARHAMVTKVRGSFAAFEGTAHLNAQDPTKSSAELTIEVDSVWTGQEQRDAHLRTNDFFDAPTFPTITFVSTSVAVTGEDTFQMTGDLTIKGVTRQVTVDFELTGTAKDPFGNLRVGFDGKTVVNRTDWGVNFNAALETGGVLVSEKVTLEFDVSAIKQAPAA